MDLSKDETRKNVTRFGVVSYLTDVSSEMILGIFSVFFTSVLGGSTRVLGLLEGLADFCASALDYFAGYVGDRTGEYKKVAAGGYSLSAFAKVILAISSTLGGAFAFRIIDRLGKSIRGAPRDAWLASVVSFGRRGYAFALHKTFDKLGAITGPLIAFAMLKLLGESGGTYHLLFALAVVPGIVAILLLLRIPQRPMVPTAREGIWRAYRAFSPQFKRYVRCAAIFGLSYFSFSFFLLKAHAVGFSVAQVALLYAVVSIAFVLVAVPIGTLGDAMGRKPIIALSYFLFALVCAGFAVATTKLQVVLLLLGFGIFLAIDESQTKAYVTDLERERRGSAIGFYNFVLAFGYVAASTIAGFLWTIDPAFTFIYGATLAGIACIVFLVRMRTSVVLEILRS